MRRLGRVPADTHRHGSSQSGRPGSAVARYRTAAAAANVAAATTAAARATTAAACATTTAPHLLGNRVMVRASV